MKSEGVLKVTNQELRKLKVIEEVIERKIKQRKAAKLLGMSVRQIIRLVKRIRREGAKGIVHRLRGKPSNHRYDGNFKEKVIKLCWKKYKDFGPTLAQEKLEELDKLYVNRETLRQWMIVEGLWELARKGREHREWRERRASFGEMIQVDGSHHDWLEGRGPWLVLMGYIDDATGDVFAKFYDYEGTMPAMESFYGYTKKYGLPHTIYMDRLRAYCGNETPSLEDQLQGKAKHDSQFERALHELWVEVIHAQSPQAKGRIERLFRTFQDRLIKEMRLAGIKTKEEANRFLETYLPKYNRRFSVKARNEANLHRPAPKDQVLRQILSIQEKRVVRNDHTIRYGTTLYQLLNLKNVKQLKEVTVQERIDGKFYFVHEEKELPYRELQEPPRKYAPKKEVHPLSARKKRFPSKDHPWKKLCLPPNGQNPVPSQDFLHLNAFKPTISNQDNLQHHPNLTYQQDQQFQQKEESNKEAKEPLLIHS